MTATGTIPVRAGASTGRRGPGGDRGLTLVELLVTMTMLGVLMPLVFGAIIRGQQQTSDSIARIDAADQVRLGLQQIDRQVRSADALFPATPDSVQVLTQDDPGIAGARCVQWQVAGGVLKTRTWLPGATPTDVRPWRNLAYDLVNAGLGVAPFPTTAATATTDAQLSVDLRVKSTRSSAEPTRLTTVLTPRNTDTTGATCPTPP